MKPSQASKRNRRKKKKTSNNRANASPSAAPPPPPLDGGGGVVHDSGDVDDTQMKREVEEEEEVERGGMEEESDEIKTLTWLADAFAFATLEQVNSAYAYARGDPYRAAEILGASGGSLGGSGAGRKKMGGGRKQKRVVAATGMVSDVIGKGYGKSVSLGGGKRCDFAEEKGVGNGKEACSREEVQEFLCSMLGDSCELDAEVIRDVFGHCGYDVGMTLDVLLDMSASSNKQSNSSDYDYVNDLNYLEISREGSADSHVKNNMQKCKLMDRASDSTFQQSERGCAFLQSAEDGCRDHNKVLGSSFQQPSSMSDTTTQNLPQKVLESFFNISDYSEHEPNRMDWKKVVKKLESFGLGLDLGSVGTGEPPRKASSGNEDSYHAFRSVARQHWDKMRSYYQNAAVAYSKGQRAHATLLSEKGKYFSKLAREADEKASREIFEARNKDIRNEFTIDLHGQHVKQAMGLLKLHILLLTYSPSIHLLRVITGSGTHGPGFGKGKLKQSAISILNKEGIQWREENSGTLIIKVDRFKEYSFVKSECDSD